MRQVLLIVLRNAEETLHFIWVEGLVVLWLVVRVVEVWLCVASCVRLESRVKVDRGSFERCLSSSSIFLKIFVSDTTNAHEVVHLRFHPFLRFVVIDHRSKRQVRVPPYGAYSILANCQIFLVLVASIWFVRTFLNFDSFCIGCLWSRYIHRIRLFCVKDTTVVNLAEDTAKLRGLDATTIARQGLIHKRGWCI